MRRLREPLLLGLLLALALASPAGGAGPSRMTLAAQTAADGTVRVVATVIDGRGAPVPDASITFRARTTFGWLNLGETSTGADGRADVIVPSGAGGTEIVAEVVGGGTVQAAILLGERAPSELRVRPGRDALRRLSPQPGFISPYPVPLQVGFLALVLGGIWGIYGYVVSQLLRIRQGR